MATVTEDNIEDFLATHTPQVVHALSTPELRILADAVNVDLGVIEGSRESILEKVMAKLYGHDDNDFLGHDSPELVPIVESSPGDGEPSSVSVPLNDPSSESNTMDVSLSIERIKLQRERYQQETEIKLQRMKLQHETEIKLQQMKLQHETENSQQETARQQLKLQHETEQEQIKLQREKLHLETEQLRLSNSSVEGVGRVARPTSEFDVTKHAKMVPQFNEEDPTGYFLSFERLAENMGWPQEKWALLLQCVLKGRAMDAYTAMPTEESTHYMKVKEHVLRTYELVPEAYRLKFRNFTKTHNVTFAQHLHDMRKALNRWLHSTEVGDDYTKLYDLLLFENFCYNLPKEIKIHLADHNITDPEDAAILADKYHITHKGNNVNNVDRSKSNTSVNASKPVIFSRENKSKNESSNNTEQANVKNIGYKSSEPQICFYCHKPGHVARHCYVRMKEIKGSREAYLRDHKTVAFIRGKPMESDVDEYADFKSKGFISTGSSKNSVSILRDTGASSTLVRKGALVSCPVSEQYVILRGIGGSVSAPIVEVNLECELYSGKAKLAVVDVMPIEGVDVLLGNDIAGGKVKLTPMVSVRAEESKKTEKYVEENNDLFPVCVSTRGQVERQKCTEKCENLETELGLTDLFNPSGSSHDHSDTNQEVNFRELQRADEDLKQMWTSAEEDPDSNLKISSDGVLVRKFIPRDCDKEDEPWRTVQQIVVPKKLRRDLVCLAHEGKMSGHMGVRKTLDRLTRNFYWPGIKREVAEWCRSCDVCQKAGKPNQTIKNAPLTSVPIFEEPFERIIIDVVGPLPRTANGNEYIFTMMDAATRFPEAIPLRNVKSRTIAREMIKFFTKFGLPKEVQSDCGSNFTSLIMQQILEEMDIKQIHSSPYHPQSQGALERFHQTLKSTLRKFCEEQKKDWDIGLPLVLFAVREVPNESLGFSPFELLFAHDVRGPLRMIEQTWRAREEVKPCLKTVSDMKERLKKAWEIAGANMKSSQMKMKEQYDKKSKQRSFSPGDEVVMFSSVAGDPLSCKFSGPFKVLKKISPVNYVIATPDRRKKERNCHINLLKKYHRRQQTPEPEEKSPTIENKEVLAICVDAEEKTSEEGYLGMDAAAIDWRDNSNLAEQLPERLSHLQDHERIQLKALLMEYKDVFKNTPGKTNLIEHDVDIEEARPVKQRPYRVNPKKNEIIEAEVAYMLQHKMVEPCSSEWSSPVTLVSKPGGSVRLCIDYRELNKASKTDAYPLPRVDSCIDTVGKARYITKLDLLKGFWQVPLTKRAQELSCFVTMGGTYRCKVMPFGMKNASATFQRLMNDLTSDLVGCVAYIDDLIVYSDTWKEHLIRLKSLLQALKNANLVVKLNKCEFAHARVEYLGYVVGRGIVAPPKAKVEAICNMPTPQNRKEVRRILGMAGYYRMFISNFSDVVFPLTNLLRKDKKFKWTEECRNAYELLKITMSSTPFLLAPNFDKPFKLAIDASNVGAGAVLLQEDGEDVERPVSYYSKKFNQAQSNYSVIEKELLALILALQFYSPYVGPSDKNLTVYTDHHPLKYLNKFQNKNQRLTRWSLLLQEFDLNIVHVRGKDNIVPDLLSRNVML